MTDVRAAAAALNPAPYPVQTPNGEERRYRRANGSLSYVASFTKGLPHDGDGLVDGMAYRGLLKALEDGSVAAFAALPGQGRFVDPTAGLGSELMGPDPPALALGPAPQIDSAEAAAELAELYWMALLRDVPFREFEEAAPVGQAVAQLNRFYAFSGSEPIAAARVRARLEPATLFRGVLPGDRKGPYLSQLLWTGSEETGKAGRSRDGRRVVPPPAKVDYGCDWDGWLGLQNGASEAPATRPTGQSRFPLTPRDLAAYVAGEPGIQPYVEAARFLLDSGLTAGDSPLARPPRIAGVALFGLLHLDTLLAEVAVRALRAAAFQKWYVHRRLRPEAMAGLVELNRRIATGTSGAVPTSFHPHLEQSGVLEAIAGRAESGGNHLLPLAYVGGAPLSPSYGSGHAAVAGACVTVLKAFFDGGREMPRVVEPDAPGRRLVTRDGEEGLTVGGELNKLASNMALGRSFSGVNYFSDYTEGLWLGENIAVGIMREQKLGHYEEYRLTLTPFFGPEPVVL